MQQPNGSWCRRLQGACAVVSRVSYRSSCALPYRFFFFAECGIASLFKKKQSINTQRSRGWKAELHVHNTQHNISSNFGLLARIYNTHCTCCGRVCISVALGVLHSPRTENKKKMVSHTVFTFRPLEIAKNHQATHFTVYQNIPALKHYVRRRTRKQRMKRSGSTQKQSAITHTSGATIEWLL